MRKTVFCEYEFWKKFMEIRPENVMPNNESIATMQRWINLFSFCCQSNLKMDITDGKLEELTNTDIYLRMLWKKSTSGECGFNCIDERFPVIEQLSIEDSDSEKLNSIYLTMQSADICKQKAQDYGIMVLNIDEIKNTDYLFRDNGVAIKKADKDFQNWSFLKETAKHHCNSIIIVDNYILSDTHLIKDNLISILDILLPDSLKVPFHISIFCNDMKNQEKDRFDLIKKEIEKIRSSLDFRLTIYKCNSSDFHDRGIISNYIWVDCGSGFDLFKKDKGAQKSTKVSIVYPFFQSTINWANSAYLNLINDAQKVNKNAVRNEETKYYNYWGDNVNRLLEDKKGNGQTH